jgi:replicative DNA helicase
VVCVFVRVLSSSYAAQYKGRFDMSEGKGDPLDIIFSPAQVARTGTAYIEERVSNRNEGIPFGVPKVDADFLPLLPGELLTLIARPSHGKTSHMIRWARHRARHLQANQITNRVVVYLTHEQHVEELHALVAAAETGVPVDMMARGTLDDAQIELVRDYGVRRPALPLWLVGHSQERRKRRPRIDLTSVEASLRKIENWDNDGTRRDLKIDMLFVDYLQRIPMEGNPESKTISIDNNLNHLKDIGLEFACPVVVGVQAKRDVDSYQVQIPEMGDGAWSASIEQVSDKVLACVRPSRYKKDGEMFGKTIVEGSNQALLVMWKQKMGPAPKYWWMTFDPQYNRLNEADEITVSVTPDDWRV